MLPGLVFGRHAQCNHGDSRNTLETNEVGRPVGWNLSGEIPHVDRLVPSTGVEGWKVQCAKSLQVDETSEATNEGRKARERQVARPKYIHAVPSRVRSGPKTRALGSLPILDSVHSIAIRASHVSLSSQASPT